MNAHGVNDRAPAEGGVLLTGVTGFIGMELLARYLERTDRRIYALVRAPDEAGARQRLRSTLECLCGDADAHADRLVAVPGDIERPGLGIEPRRRAQLAAQVSDVVHSAASVSFTLPLAESRQINVEGTRRVLELAESCRDHGGLNRFSYISTAYVGGTHSGEFREDQLDVGQGFRNPYERSKFEAETLVRTYFDRLPIQIFRPSIVVGDSTSGWTASFNVLYAPLKAFARDALPAIPARREAPVDVVPVDYVADAVFELSSRPLGAQRTFHLVAGSRATTVGRLVEASAGHMGKSEPRVIPPWLYTRLVYPMLVRRASGKRRQALQRTRVYFPYFALDLLFGDRVARGRLERAGIRLPVVERYFPRLIDYALEADWGRREVTRAQARGGGRRYEGRPRSRARRERERPLAGAGVGP